jgi:hypothetical protein
LRLFDNDVHRKGSKSTPSVYRVKYRQKLGFSYYLIGFGKFLEKITFVICSLCRTPFIHSLFVASPYESDEIILLASQMSQLKMDSISGFHTTETENVEYQKLKSRILKLLDVLAGA